jgi:serine/threonine-protein kinase
MLQDAGFRPRTINQDVDDPSQDGVVLSQNPTGNAQARPGSTVTIVVGRFNP